MDNYELLQQVSFGKRVAEEEADSLSTYFVETDQWKRLYRGDIDVIYGPKGSGKSALYALLNDKTNQLFDRSIILVPAENPRGTPAFNGLLTDPPTSEQEFVGLWKLYIASLLHSALAGFEVRNSNFNKLEESLVRDNLVKGVSTLSSLLSSVRQYIRGFFRPTALEGTVNLDPITGMPSGFTGKIIFSEAGSEASGLRSVDELLRLADLALTEAGLTAWLLLDRLDVAFAENNDLEGNALRALFRVYLDMGNLNHVSLKIFLRTDIWTRIVEGGFREASHITRHSTLVWNRSSLLNLVVRRAVHNRELRDKYGWPETLSHQSVTDQENALLEMWPGQVDVGPNKPATFDWLLSRTRDGLKLNAPRELIHILNSLRDIQIRRMEVGDDPRKGDVIFARPAFKPALPEVSRVRLEQTLYAEHPALKVWIEKLKEARTAHTPKTLADRWQISEQEAAAKANELSAVGFFEKRGSPQDPEYWVPFLYRDALEMTQGAAE